MLGKPKSWTVWKAVTAMPWRIIFWLPSTCFSMHQGSLNSAVQIYMFLPRRVMKQNITPVTLTEQDLCWGLSTHKNELLRYTLKVSCNGRGKTRARDGRAGKKPHFYGIGFILPNSFYKSFTLALNNTLFHVCILNLFNPSQKCHVSNTVESYLSSAVPEIQKKILTILPFQISRKYYF